MNPQLIIAASIAIAGFGGGWQLQSWRYAAKENERAKQELIQVQTNAATSIRRMDSVIFAQNSANARNAVLLRDLGIAHSELDRLRTALAGLPGPSGPPEACANRAATEGKLLLNCAERYTELAGKADRHASDAQTLMEAWPK